MCVGFGVVGFVFFARFAREKATFFWKFWNAQRQPRDSVSDFPVPLYTLRGLRLLSTRNAPRTTTKGLEQWLFRLVASRCFDYVFSKIHSTQLSKHTHGKQREGGRVGGSLPRSMNRNVAKLVTIYMSLCLINEKLPRSDEE